MSASQKDAHVLVVTGMIGRALRSTAVIGAIAFVLLELKFGRFRLADVKVLLAAYWGFLVVIFFGILIWDYWFWRTRRIHFGEDKDRES